MRQYRSLRMFKGKISFLIDSRAVMITLVLIGVAAALLIASTGLGDMKMNPLAVISVFFGGGTDLERLVVLDFRLPRIIVALFVGMALAVAGGILQGIIRNPLASPDIIGITGGAGAAVVGFLAFFSTETDNALTVSIQWLPVAAFAGASITAFLVYFLSWRGGVSPIRLVLIGIGISALMQAITTMVMILGPIYRASQANIWLTGTVNGASWEKVTVLVPWTVLLLVIALISARKINVQELGDDLAAGMSAITNNNTVHGTSTVTFSQLAPFTVPVSQIFAWLARYIGPRIITIVVIACMSAEIPIPISTSLIGDTPPRQDKK